MITSVNNERIKQLIKLKNKRQRMLVKEFLVEGEHLVFEALKSQCVKEIFVTESFKKDISFKNITIVSEHVLEKLAFSKTPQPIIALCEMQKHNIDLIQAKRILLLDNVQDPGNVGTMMRTAIAFGYDALVLSQDSVDLYNDKLIRATQGAIFKLPVIQVELDDYIAQLKNHGFICLATSLRNAKAIHEYENLEKMAFVMGNEGNGVSEHIQHVTDGGLYIPIQNIESLNVAIAAGIVMQRFNGFN